MKKFLGYLCLFIVFVGSSLFFSCSSEEKSIRVSYLQIWSDNLNKVFEDICQEWGEINSVKVILEPVALKDLDMKIANLVDSKSGADVAVFPSHQIVIYKDELEDFTDIVNTLIQKYGDFYRVPAAMNRLENKWYAVPLYSWSHIWVYRDDILKDNNLEIPKSYDEVQNMCERISERNKNIFPIGIGLGKDDDAAMFFQSTLWAFGGKVTEKDGETIAINSQETRDAIKYILSLYEKGFLPKGVLGWDGASNNKNFLAGKIVLTMNSPTIYYVAKRDNPEIYKNIKHTLYPKGPHGQFSYATGFSLSTVKGNKNIKIIKSLIKYLFKFENYSKLIVAGEGSVNPSIKGFEELNIWDDPNLKVALDSMAIEMPIGYPGPVTKAASIVFQRRILTDMFGRIINDGLTVDDAIVEAEKSIKEVYDSYK